MDDFILRTNLSTVNNACLKNELRTNEAGKHEINFLTLHQIIPLTLVTSNHQKFKQKTLSVTIFEKEYPIYELRSLHVYH